MKTIIATVAAAAAITAGVTVAGAQDLGGSSAGVSPYVGFEYTTKPTYVADGATADTWWGGARSMDVVLGAEVALPWDLSMDASVGFNNTDWTFDYTMSGVDISISYEVMDGVSVFSNTAFDGELDRESTSVGVLWKF